MEIGTYLFTGRLCIERKLIGLSSRRRHIYCKYNNLIEKNLYKLVQIPGDGIRAIYCHDVVKADDPYHYHHHANKSDIWPRPFDLDLNSVLTNLPSLLATRDQCRARLVLAFSILT